MMNDTRKDSLAWAHPIVRTWFNSRFTSPTKPQEKGWPFILSGKSTLISAPTGSGKTLAAFLVCIDGLIRQAFAGELSRQTRVVYISPLKALTNDIQKNLLEPLKQIQATAVEQGMPLPEIEVAVRTGDTLARERQAMLKKPPHILVTTPESFYLLLTAEKSRAMLRDVTTVIVDEIHALANNKRGSHLSLSLERLEALTVNVPLRIGLSATQKPIELVGHFLTGMNRPPPGIIHIGHARHLELHVEVPDSELGPVTTNEMWDEIYDRIAELANQNRSTLVFVNTRRLAERAAHHLAQRLGKEQVAAHHGSLSRKLRLGAETSLKTGQLKLLVATASLELGIDIGTVDLVCQIGSPRAIAVALQRVGRAGHWYGAISKGRFFATTRDELLECAALIYAIGQGDLDQLIIPEQPLDILAQQMVAICATEDSSTDHLFELVKKSFPYRHLTRETFNDVLDMLAEGMAGSRGRYGACLFYDRVHEMVKARRGARMNAIVNGGAIPDNSLFTVVAEEDGAVVGTLDEDFAVESNRGDIILLGNTSWQIKGIENAKGRVLVEDAHGAPPSVPFWIGEAPERTRELSIKVSELRQMINDWLPLDTTDALQAVKAIDWLKKHCRLNESAARQLIHYILEGRALLGTVPTRETIIAERFFDESGGMQLIIHSPFGARINKAWGLALRKRFCRSFNFELQAAATDNGIAISLAEQHSFPLGDVFHFLHPNTVRHVLTQAVLQSPVFKTRWRWDATRALAIARFRNGKKVPPNIVRMLSDDLLAAVFPDAAACQDNLAGQDIVLPDHPLIFETMKDCLTEALDVDGLGAVLSDIAAEKIRCVAVDTPTPSVFSHEILNANPYAFLDDAPLEERRTRAVSMRRILPDSWLDEIGRLDEQAIRDVQQQVWPDLRSADELHDFLQAVIALPVSLPLNRQAAQCPEQWSSFFNELAATGRAGRALAHQQEFRLAAEKQKIFLAAYPDTSFQDTLAVFEEQTPEFEDALLSVVRGWVQYLGPFNAEELASLLALPRKDIEQTLLKLEATGLILRGHFTTSGDGTLEWCERRLLARIHALTLNRLRQEIEPISVEQFIHWLANWQHLASGTQLRGERGLLEVIKQLQGYEMPANAWEKQIFAKRVSDYSPDLLDRLCFSGTIGWGRLALHPAITSVMEEEAGDGHEPISRRAIQPTSTTPVTFFVREDTAWLVGKQRFSRDGLQALSHVARRIYGYLQEEGASFFIDMVQDLGHLKTEIEMGLWELVAAGLITADGFDNLRALIDPRRRAARRGRRPVLFRQTTGRWSLLKTSKPMAAGMACETIAWVLLRRYGVCFRELVSREKMAPSWSELLTVFRRLEVRGDIRGGRFVRGFTGEQYALPYAVDSLRAFRKQQPKTENITISAVDPLNLAGIILPGERVSQRSGKQIVISAQARK
ncbi:helicase, DEAD/DEAH box family [Legionella spiritensis]|nr:DEAD/DEAH box helicase [Legionella spiritensis]VEG92071.1 helicase, DEAD/DEAH box family [Legionella spiritensis]